MRATFAWSPSETIMLLPSLRFTLGDFDVRMCRVFVWLRLILPLPVFLKRLAAPEWVFNLGIFSLVLDQGETRSGRTHRFPCAGMRTKSVYLRRDFAATRHPDLARRPGRGYVERMAVLSVNLAYGRWTDLGIVVLERGAEPESPVQCEIVLWNEPGPVEAEVLAGRLNHLCAVRDIRVMVLDGPQAWKSRENGLQHARVSEKRLNTAAKTGLPGVVKPVTSRRFAEFCVDVFDALCRRKWRRLETTVQPGLPAERIVVESYPHAAWKALGIKPLPSKRRAKVSDLAEAFAALKAVAPLTVNRPPNHDQLQAIVGGLPGLALEARDAHGALLVGKAPRREDGQWREGFIVVPEKPRTGTSGVKWLN